MLQEQGALSLQVRAHSHIFPSASSTPSRLVAPPDGVTSIDSTQSQVSDDPRTPDASVTVSLCLFKQVQDPTANDLDSLFFTSDLDIIRESIMSIAVTSQTLGGFHVDGIKQESIDEVNRLLQHNHEAFHVIYNTAAGMHNHHVHYLLTDLSLGATPAQLREAYHSNESYQRPIDAGAEGKQIVVDEESYGGALGKFENYAAWLAYFERQVAQKGAQETMQEYLFARTPRADDMLGRMFDGESALVS